MHYSEFGIEGKNQAQKHLAHFCVFCYFYMSRRFN